jgi:hypothetical protein
VLFRLWKERAVSDSNTDLRFGWPTRISGWCQAGVRYSPNNNTLSGKQDF